MSPQKQNCLKIVSYQILSPLKLLPPFSPTIQILIFFLKPAFLSSPMPFVHGILAFQTCMFINYVTLRLAWLSMYEYGSKGDKNTRVVRLIPAWTIYLRPGLDDPCGWSLPTLNYCESNMIS